LKQPDEFVSFWTHLGSRIAAHRRKVMRSSCLLWLWAAYLGWHVWKRQQATRETEAFSRIEKTALAPLLP